MAQQPISLLVIGAGVMGSGIAQITAQAGHSVWLYDKRPGAATAAKAQLALSLQKRLDKGKLSEQAMHDILGQITPIDDLTQAQEATPSLSLVIEAIAEDLSAKQALFHDLEKRLPSTCIFASNTSALSITAIGKGLKHPERLAGMHFFNPVPVMRLVEIVSGLQTDSSVAKHLFALAQDWGKTPVYARSTPGFIANRIARPFYAEALALLKEQGNLPQPDPSNIDACLRGAGFRMGPCALMDLIGLDIGYAVTQAMYEANFYDKRYQPSGVQRELVEAGFLGRKSGRGFYQYGSDGKPVANTPPTSLKSAQTLRTEGCSKLAQASPQDIVLHGNGVLVERLAQACTQAQLPFSQQSQSTWNGIACKGLEIHSCTGQTATALQQTRDNTHVAVVDWIAGDSVNGISSADPNGPSATIGFALGQQLQAEQAASSAEQVGIWLQAIGLTPLALADTPGLVVARTIAMLINEAADTVQQGVCTSQAADTAMKLGLNYPAGPFEWLNHFGVDATVQTLTALDTYYRGERYRISPWLQQRWAMLGNIR